MTRLQEAANLASSARRFVDKLALDQQKGAVIDANHLYWVSVDLLNVLDALRDAGAEVEI